MALDHYISQVHLKNFYSPAPDGLMYAMGKSDLKRSPDVRGDDGRAFGEQPSDTGRPDAAAGTRYQDSPIFKAFQ
jgi:hypothetical protein